MGGKILIIGSGKMTKAISRFLCGSPRVDKVVLASIDPAGAAEILRYLKSPKASFTRLDAADRGKTTRLMRKFDCAISAIPYFHNYRLASSAVAARCNFIDLGGNNDVVAREFSLSADAKRRGVAIVPDCGLAPGLASNLTALGLAEFGGEAERVNLRVGGLPQHPKPPLNYMIVFAVEGLINEYVEPSIIIENHRVKTVPSMTGVEKINFKGFGALEAFYTSGGTSTMPATLKDRVRFLDYKTIRYPGHAEKIRLLMDLGLASGKTLAPFNAAPRKMLEKLLIEKLAFKDRDLVLMRAAIEDRRKRVVFELIDREKSGLTAMMRSTGFPAAAIAEMIVAGEISKKGTLKHELDIPADILVAKLRRAGLRITRKVSYKR
jgi:lysine 6-dehydrogenase